MPRLHEFAREERLPSYWANRIQDFLSAARTDLRVSLKDPTHVEVIPVEPYGIAAIDLQGLWRFRETPVSRAHPGGAAGTYVVWAVATKQKVVEAPKPFTDETNYAFDLRITNGANPAGEGVEVFEKIAEVDWDGVSIIALRQTYNAVTGAMIAPGALSSGAGGDLIWTREPSGAILGNLRENSVGAFELADGSVDVGAIINLAVSTAKIAAEAITEEKLSGNSVATVKIVNLAVTTAKIAALAVTQEKIAGEAVGTGQIQALAITAAKLAAEAVETGKIANLAVTAGKLAALCVEESKIADGAVTSRKFKPTVGVVRSTTEFGLGAGFTEVTGCKLEITPLVPSKLKVAATVGATISGVGGLVEATLFVDGVEQKPLMHTGNGGGTESFQALMASQDYVLTLTAAAHIITLRARGNAGGTCRKEETGFTYELVAS